MGEFGSLKKTTVKKHQMRWRFVGEEVVGEQLDDTDCRTLELTVFAQSTDMTKCIRN